MGKVYLKGSPTGVLLHDKAAKLIVIEGALYILDEYEDVVQVFASGVWEAISLNNDEDRE